MVKQQRSMWSMEDRHAYVLATLAQDLDDAPEGRFIPPMFHLEVPWGIQTVYPYTLLLELGAVGRANTWKWGEMPPQKDDVYRTAIEVYEGKSDDALIMYALSYLLMDTVRVNAKQGLAVDEERGLAKVLSDRAMSKRKRKRQ